MQRRRSSLVMPCLAAAAWSVVSLSWMLPHTNAAYPVTIDPLIFTETKLLRSDAEADTFGWRVAISGDTAVVGAPQHDDSVGGTYAGVAYVFVRSDGIWSQQQELKPSDRPTDARFGYSVGISGDTVVIGALADDNFTGSAYVFVRNGNTWSQQQKLTASDKAAADSFGASVGISGDTVIVGAPFDDDPAAGTNAGSAYVFVRSGAVWSEQQKLLAGDKAAGDDFGDAVGINGDTVIVGVRDDDDPVAGQDAGSAYVFVRSGVVWNQQQKLTASDMESFAAFGNSVGISGDTVIVGAPLHLDPVAGKAGAAYVFVRSGGVWTQQQMLTASVMQDDALFGWSVGIAGDVVVVGAPRDNDSTAGAAAGGAYAFLRAGVAWNQAARLTASDKAAVDFFGDSVAISGDTIICGAPTKSSNFGAAYVYVNTTAADLIVSLGEDKVSVKEGETLTYTITVKNFGPNRSLSTVVNDTLSSGTTLVSVSVNRGKFTAPPKGQTGTITWYPGEVVPSGQEDAYIQVSVIVRGKTTITNTAQVQSASADPNPVNNSASITTTVSPGKGK